MTVAEEAGLGRVGIWTSSLDALTPAAAGQIAAELEAQGWGTLWFGEAYGREAFTQAGLLLAATGRMRVATGIANIWARDAVAANAASRTLAAAHGGRFVLGLGVSHRPLVERVRGGSYTKPVAAMREYLTAMAGATFYAAEADEPRPPVLVAALGPRMLEVARELADGSHPYLVTPQQTADVRAALGPDRLVAVEMGAVLTSDRETALRRAHAHLDIYTGLPNYRNNWLRGGFDETDLVRGGSDRLAEALIAWGDEAAILRRVREHLAAGADHVCVQVLMDSPFDVPTTPWRELAPALVGA
ncbi:TIGR03620 family F420-dependent LLM class oxidoreductase [Streptomyces phaeochromogenes]|uniref:TIGR03620 family F420-dependent LLM class oxidoreductase n=1 Tax=Streptomyces phaeochromogenes TaxID=1923 RepID=UPI0036B1E26A